MAIFWPSVSYLRAGRVGSVLEDRRHSPLVERGPKQAASVYYPMDVSVRHGGAPVTIPARTPATVWPSGGKTFDAGMQRWTTFTTPTGGHYVTPQDNLASVGAGTEVWPLERSTANGWLRWQPRVFTPPGPPPGLNTRRFMRFLLRNTDEGVSAPPGFLGNWDVTSLAPVATYALDVAPGASAGGGAVNAFASATITPSSYAPGATIPLVQIVSAPLDPVSIPASTDWQLCYLPSFFSGSFDTTYHAYIWLGIADAAGHLKATIIPVQRAGAGPYLGGVFSADHQPRTVYEGGIAGAAVDTAAGDYLVLELGFTSAIGGSWGFGVYGGGSLIFVVDDVQDNRVRDFIDGPFSIS